MKLEDIEKAVVLKAELADVDALLKDFGYVEYYGGPRDVSMRSGGTNDVAVLRLGQVGEVFMAEMLKAILTKLTFQRQEIIGKIEAL